jgi:hypothetical protein
MCQLKQDVGELEVNNGTNMQKGLTSCKQGKVSYTYVIGWEGVHRIVEILFHSVVGSLVIARGKGEVGEGIIHLMIDLVICWEFTELHPRNLTLSILLESESIQLC